MLRTHYASQLKDAANKTVKVAGWVHTKREMGSLLFIVLRDETGFIQVTAKKDKTDEMVFSSLKSLKKESVVLIEGECIKNKKAPGGFEILPAKVDVLSSADELPIDLSKGIKTSLDKRLDARCVDLRRPENHAIFKIESHLVKGMQEYLDKQGFIQVFTPCIMGVPSESGSEVFAIMYYEKEAFLRQDPQLHRQLTIAGGFEKIYDIGPSWRAEPSHTTKHLCEHRAIAVEMAFIENEYDVMKLEEAMVINGLKKVAKECKNELELLNIKIKIPKKFPVLEFPKIYNILEKMGMKVKFGKAYGTEGEKLLWDYVKKKYKSDFFFVNRFPFAEKPFYVMRYDDDPIWARSTDLIFRGIELSSGGQREHRYEKIIEQAKEKDMSLHSIEWFAKFFKYGVPPHGGFAIGLERFIMALLNLSNVREAVLFPRDTERLVP